MTHDATWQAVLVDADAERAGRIVDAIASSLMADTPPTVMDGDSALTDGLPGWALFFASLHHIDPHRGHDDTARRMLDAAVEESDAISGSQALFGGITGLAWALQHLAPPDHPAPLEDIDAAMHRALAAAPIATNFDLISGLAGLGVLGIERADAPLARATLERLVFWLDACAEHTPQGTSWRVPHGALHETAQAEFPQGCHYTGVAHGTAGVVGLLAGLLTLGIAPATTRRLLAGAVKWLVAQELPGNMALFPLQLDVGNPRPASRSAWCTGGPGISLMLWRAGQAAGEPDWQTRAAALARSAASRPLAEMGVRDACLCHGTAGLGLIYARWFHETGDAFFLDESRRWFRRTLDHHRPGEGVGGYAAANAPKGRQDAAPGLLFGAAGVGLALLAATTAHEPAWDRAFLMSGPRAPDRR